MLYPRCISFGRKPSLGRWVNVRRTWSESCIKTFLVAENARRVSKVQQGVHSTQLLRFAWRVALPKCDRDVLYIYGATDVGWWFIPHASFENSRFLGTFLFVICSGYYDVLLHLWKFILVWASDYTIYTESLLNFVYIYLFILYFQALQSSGEWYAIAKWRARRIDEGKIILIFSFKYVFLRTKQIFLN